ncbi:unnamed protein product [Spirodela intermedia]|uniref:Reverse transcriptase Ty1/copia-type domain-containing protein n=1 Tax=Spirodela intermedia TaxID=51605 RepID=A0A7I8KGT4_SPIIN|nr:unnamed protein product [Spirodela intermedia]
MEQPLRYIIMGESSNLKWSQHAWFTKFSCLLTTFNFSSYVVDLTILTKKTKGSLVIFAVYIDDIFMIGSDDADIHYIKAHLQQHLSICDLGTLRYFLGN